MQFDTLNNRRSSDSEKWHHFPEDILPMWVADMDFRSPTCVIEALQNRVAHGIFGYTCDEHLPKEAVIAWAQKRYAWQIHPEEIIFLSGVVGGLHLTVQSLTQPGQAILFFPPVYPPFFKITKYAQRNENLVPLLQDEDGKYHIDFDALENNDFPQTAMLVLCNPHNPVGRVFSRQELQKLAAICKKKNWLVCSDEIHCDLIFDDLQHIPFASINEDTANRTITLFAPSKTFNIAGLKCSVMVVKNEELRQRIKMGMRGLVTTPNLLAVTAANAAYLGGESWLTELLEYLTVNRDFCCDFINHEMTGCKMVTPQGTFLAWIDCSNAVPSQEPADFFLEKARVGLSRGSEYGIQGKNFVRLNFGCPRSVLQTGLQRMKKALTER